jgi:hypothetical protein
MPRPRYLVFETRLFRLVLESAMPQTPLPRPSVSPLPSFATVPARSPSFVEMAAAIWAWIGRVPATVAERRHADFEVARIRAQIEDEDVEA